MKGALSSGYLTGCEIVVLRKIASGCPNRCIAIDLGRSIKTVEAHRFNLLRKLSARCTADLTRAAIELGLIVVTVTPLQLTVAKGQHERWVIPRREAVHA